MKTYRRYLIGMAAVFLLLGFVLGGMSMLLDLTSFFKGMCQGASVMLIVCATYIGARHLWWGSAKRDDAGATWLPSREQNQADGADRP
ncbi:hypothetical protein [Arthrobacter sp. YD2]|uniref:hypothetical protein n=1 Tax=Arthrobacter sp. YD2 TaxID=3058046 RepID=UPI0025B3C4E0|nr:hypothetical protein [Arthrobacter sp. YD2]MDN3903279.1 hypothetical protein [Arthrobacter sp. YD2]